MIVFQTFSTSKFPRPVQFVTRKKEKKKEKKERVINSSKISFFKTYRPSRQETWFYLRAEVSRRIYLVTRSRHIYCGRA